MGRRGQRGSESDAGQVNKQIILPQVVIKAMKRKTVG